MSIPGSEADPARTSCDVAIDDREHVSGKPTPIAVTTAASSQCGQVEAKLAVQH